MARIIKTSYRIVLECFCHLVVRIQRRFVNFKITESKLNNWMVAYEAVGMWEEMSVVCLDQATPEVGGTEEKHEMKSVRAADFQVARSIMEYTRLY